MLSMLLKYLLSGTCTRTNVGCIRGDEGIEAAQGVGCWVSAEATAERGRVRRWAEIGGREVWR